MSYSVMKILHSYRLLDDIAFIHVQRLMLLRKSEELTDFYIKKSRLFTNMDDCVRNGFVCVVLRIFGALW